MFTYTWYQWLAFFYIYCFFGWIFESAYVSTKQRRFVNRGFLRSPMLPLYGSGAVMMLWVSLPVRDNLFLVYCSGVIAATALEYITGYVMERLFKVRYWDYSNQKFQLHGYICLTSSIAWGFLTILMTEVIHAPVSRLVLSFNQNILLLCLVLITALFTADAYESTKEALALGKSLEAMTKMKEEIEELQARISALKEEAAEHAMAAREEAVERLYAVKEETEERLAAAKTETAERIAAAKSETAERLAAAKSETAERIAAIREGAAERLAAVMEETAERLAAVMEGTGEPMAPSGEEALDPSAPSKEGAAERLAAARMEAVERLAAVREETLERIAAIRDTSREHLAQLTRQLDETKARRSALQPKSRLRRFYRKGLLSGNPGAVSSKFSAALKELKEQLEHE